MPQQFIFQQDNCPIHVSKQAHEFFSNSNIDILKWPPGSPGLNIIEYICHEFQVKCIMMDR